MEINILFVSRLGCFRAGVKFFKRGVDENGNTANYVETEQIIVTKGENNTYNVYTYSQIRGSIPIFWSQMPDLSHTPKVNRMALNQRLD